MARVDVRRALWVAACAVAWLYVAHALVCARDEEPEGFADPDPTIFISVASYRDSDCMQTLTEAFGKAKHPDRVRVGICEQNSPDTDEVCLRPEFKHHDRVRRISLPHKEALGPTYARYLCATLYRDETYFMQIDSHTRFAPDWDVRLIADLASCPSAPRAVLTHYPPTWEEMGKPTHEIGVPRLCKAKFDANGLPTLEAVTLPPTRVPAPTPFVAGGFLFGPGSMVREVPFDPDLPMLFQGEEFLHAARLWTHGYDLYTPTDNYVFHYYMRETKPKFWDDVAFGPVQEQTHAKVRRVLAGELPKYAHGMGSARTLRAYLDFAKVDWESKTSGTETVFC